MLSIISSLNFQTTEIKERGKLKSEHSIKGISNWINRGNLCLSMLIKNQLNWKREGKTCLNMLTTNALATGKREGKSHVPEHALEKKHQVLFMSMGCICMFVHFYRKFVFCNFFNVYVHMLAFL